MKLVVEHCSLQCQLGVVVENDQKVELMLKFGEQ